MEKKLSFSVDNVLNDPQKSALLEINRPVLILAGAGSGKTRVITHKIAYLIKEHGYAPWNILAVTFTNKAAKEMRERVYKLLHMSEDGVHPYSNHSLWITTFHSSCGRILRREIDKIGYKTNFTIYDTDDTKSLIKDVIKANKLPSPSENLYNIISYISRCKNQFETPEHVIQLGMDDGDHFVQQVGKIYELYEKKLFENNALDFDDLLIKTINLFETDSDTLKHYRDLFQYIMVDEFQDTNPCQYKLIKLLAEGRDCISVVGDDDQSIYSWRGADISNIINFGNDFKNCLVVKLEQNYRSTNHILNAAHSVVRRNERRLDKKIWSDKGEGLKLKYFDCDDDRSESEWVVKELLNLHDSEVPLNHIAILYRMNYQSRILEDALNREGIPCIIIGGIKFYERMEIKDMLAYLTVMVNENDSIALKRIINIPKRGIGETTLGKIDIISAELGLSFEKAIDYCVENKMLRNPAKDKLLLFFDWLREIKKKKSDMSISQFFEYIIDEIHYSEHLKENYDNYDDRLENIRELGRAIVQYESEQMEPTLEHFLMEISLRSDIDQFHEEDGAVLLMTAHNSKGLEFENVFIIGMNEGVFPHYRSIDNYEDMEEERRLFYVGITRAKMRCYLSSSNRQMSFGQIKFYKPSRFISEIHPSYIEKVITDEHDDIMQTEQEIFNHYYKKQGENRKILDKLANSSNRIKKSEDIQVGDILLHKEFGEGEVIKINEKGDMTTVLLSFPDGNRLLILKYAQLYK